VGATTGPSPPCSVCTSVRVTLNGAVTSTRGAAVSVEPVTATLPVAPVSVHSGVPPLPGAAVGQALSAVAGPVEAGDTASVKAGVPADPEDVLADGVVLSELQAASVMTADAAQATSATEEYTREKFTVVTLHPRPAVLASSPSVTRGDSKNRCAASQYDYSSGIAAYSVPSFSARVMRGLESDVLDLRADPMA
jgi:hypothetical protein